MPAYEIPGLSFSLPSAADLSVKSTSGQFRFVDVNSSAQAAVPSAGGRAIGVRQNNPKSGEATTIVGTGIVMVEASAAIAVGAGVSSTANGRSVTATGGDIVLGTALTAAGAAGELHAVLLGIRAATATGSGRERVMSFPINLAAIAGAGDVLTNFTPGFAGTITKIDFAVTEAVSTAGRAATLNMEIGTTNLTGGAVALTSANCTPLGAVIAGTAVTANNVFTATDTISIEAASVTAFAEGRGVLLVTVA